MASTNIRHDPADIAPPARGLYAHGVEAPAGSRHLFVAGQVGVRPDGSLPQAFEDQVEQMMRNIGAVLASAGMDFSDVVKVNAYCRNADEIIAYAGIRNRFFDGAPPATTAIVVPGLANPDWLIEADVVAAKRD